MYLFSCFRIFVHHKLEENQIPTLTCPTASLHLRDANYHSTIIRRIYYELEKPVRYQEMVVASPSLNSPERKRRRRLVLGEFAKYAFCGLKRKRRDFERSVLKYVSIKIPALTHSGRKSRVCVNALDRRSPRHKALPAFIPSSTRQCPRTGQTTNTARPHQAE